ncbi:hypothetical protein GCM10022223_66360 [Kineosporia mesophila]|uniref:Uncharacterized protein n=2 Tax=Kineosporia mesophila TaxID=566012 RepID=A0ABP7AQE0_9ACTN
MTFAVSGRTKAEVALIAIREQITHVGVIRHEDLVDSVHRLFTFVGLQALTVPLPHPVLAAVLKKQQQKPLLQGGGTFTPGGSTAVLSFLKTYDASAHTALLQHLRPRTPGTPSQMARRDATADALAYTGAPDLQEIDVAPKEGDLLARDAGTFLGWQNDFTDTVKVRRFRDQHDRSLKVMITDRDRLETDFGPDLLYYHQQRKSFVFVQYKRMTRSGKNMTYSADSQLDRQLKAMKQLDARCLAAATDGNYRLLHTPSFVKICRQESPALEEHTMVSGLCMPREQVEAYLQHGRTLSYETVHDALTSSDFARLVAIGMFGSSPSGSDVIRNELMNHYGPTVYAEFSDPSDLRPGGRSRVGSRQVGLRPDTAPSNGDGRSGQRGSHNPESATAQQERLFDL